MSAATALAAGTRAHPLLAAEAVEKALQRAGLARASAVLLYLGPEFSGGGDTLAAASVLAAARAAQSMQIAGAVVAGVFTEAGFSLEHPCAAALVLGDGPEFVPVAEHRAEGHAASRDPAFVSASASASALIPFPGRSSAGESSGPPARYIIRTPTPRLSFLCRPAEEEHDAEHAPHIGCVSGAPAYPAPAPVWQQGRSGTARPARVAIRGASAEILICHGFQALGPVHRNLRSRGHELLAVDGGEALDSLLRELPESPCRAAPLPLHRIFAMIVPGACRRETAADLLARGQFLGIPLLAANADGSLQLGARIPPGHALFWAQRQPEAAAAETRARIAELETGQPAFALAFSCLGRGPFFYDGEDRDLAAFTGRFPGVPLLGAYCTGQVAPFPGNRRMWNAFTLALFSAAEAREDEREPEKENE